MKSDEPDPKPSNTIQRILKENGVDNWDDGIIHHILDITIKRYLGTILTDADQLAKYSNKKELEEIDIRRAIDRFDESTHSRLPSLPELEELAAKKNKILLPEIKESVNHLPLDSQLLTQPNYILRGLDTHVAETDIGSPKLSMSSSASSVASSTKDDSKNKPIRSKDGEWYDRSIKHPCYYNVPGYAAKHSMSERIPISDSRTPRPGHFIQNSPYYPGMKLYDQSFNAPFKKRMYTGLPRLPNMTRSMMIQPFHSVVNRQAMTPMHDPVYGTPFHPRGGTMFLNPRVQYVQQTPATGNNAYVMPSTPISVANMGFYGDTPFEMSGSYGNRVLAYHTPRRNVGPYSVHEAEPIELHLNQPPILRDMPIVPMDYDSTP